MLLAIISLITALTISGVAIYYSVIGLTSIFSAAAIPIIVMGVTLEIAKLVVTVWLHKNWAKAPGLIRTYLVCSVAVLMFITSMGIFGFLSKAHSDQSLVSGDVQSKIAIYDEKIKTAKDNIDANRKALKQMDEAVDQVMGRSSDEKGADKAVAIRRAQQKERARLQSEIASEQKAVSTLNEEAAPIRAEVRKVEAEVGPIKYIAAFIYGANPDENILEKAVTWVIVIIVFVFDPLAVVLLLASQYSFNQARGISNNDEVEDEVEEVKPTLAERMASRIKNIRQWASDSVNTLKDSIHDPLTKKEIVVQEVVEPEQAVVQEVIEPEQIVETNILDEAKGTLAEFMERLEELEGTTEIVAEEIIIPEPVVPVFQDFNTPLKGFSVPKVFSVDSTANISVTKLDIEIPQLEVIAEESIPASIIPNSDNLLDDGVDAWNKMIEAAEAEVAKQTRPLEFPSNPFKGQQVKLATDDGDKDYIYNGKEWVFTPVSSSSTFQILPELTAHLNETVGYVQNEEQKESNLWEEARKQAEIDSLSQEDYQTKATKQLEKAKDDWKDNPGKST